MWTQGANDGQLITEWKRGDQSAGAELFRRYYAPILRFYRSKVGGQAPDLVQRCFLRCIEIRPRIREEDSFRCFVFGVARNVLGKHLRERYREPSALELAHVSVAELGASPSQLVAEDQRQQLMLTALRRIPLDHQTVLELHYWE